MNQRERNDYWKKLATDHIQVAHNAVIADITRNSFLVDIADEVEASEIINLHFPCVAVYNIVGRVVIKEDQRRMRYQNRLSFLNRFSIESNEDATIPTSKAMAFSTTYEVMMDFLNKLQSNYEDAAPCFLFKFIDENSYRWESVELVGSGMCGWELYFNDEEPANFLIDESKWS